MANDINSILIVGRLTKNVELKYTNNNKEYCNFSIANNEKYGETETVHFFNVVCWGKLAEICSKFISKGSQIVVQGRLKQSRYQDQSGQNRSNVQIIASSVQFVGGKKDDNNQNNPAPQQNQNDIPDDEANKRFVNNQDQNQEPRFNSKTQSWNDGAWSEDDPFQQ